MELTNQEKLNLYDTIKAELLKGKESEDDLCEKYAAKHNMEKEIVKDIYLSMEEEMAVVQEKFETMLAEGIKKSKQKSEELKTATSARAREFEDWEQDIITLAMQVRPMPKATLAKYLADVMPHRTWNAYNAHMNRKEKKKIKEEQKVENKKVDLKITKIPVVKKEKPTKITIVKIMEKGAIAISEQNEKGMLHISEITNDFVCDINDYLYVGQEVMVTEYTDFDNRIAFSAKQIKDLPKLTNSECKIPVPITINEGNLTMLLDTLINQSEKNLNDLKEFKKKAESELIKLDQLEEIKLKLNMLL